MRKTFNLQASMILNNFLLIVLKSDITLRAKNVMLKKIKLIFKSLLLLRPLQKIFSNMIVYHYLRAIFI